MMSREGRGSRLDSAAESHLCLDFEDADASTHQISLICKDFLTTPSQGIVLGGDAGLGQRVEKSGLAHVGQAHDAAFEAHGNSLCINALPGTTPMWRKCPIRIVANPVLLKRDP